MTFLIKEADTVELFIPLL